jgi:hypothetical protein
MTTATQPELSFPRVEQDDRRIDTLIGLLDRCGDWVTAGEIATRLKSITGIGQFSDRLIRDLASASRGIVASGQRGYRLTKFLAEDEKEHTCNRLRSQSREMDRRADEIEAEWLRQRNGREKAQGAQKA